MKYYKCEWLDGTVKYFVVPSLDESDIVYYWWHNTKDDRWCAEVEESWNESISSMEHWSDYGHSPLISIRQVTRLEVLLMTGQVPGEQRC